MKTRRRQEMLPVLCAGLIALCWGLSVRTADARSPKGELLFYSAAFPAINPLQQVRLTIQIDGAATARLKGGFGLREGTFRLSAEELRYLKAQIRKAMSSGEPEPDAPPGLHSPDGTFQITLDGKGKELFHSSSEGVGLLVGFVWKCLRQVELMGELREGRPSSVLSSLSPRSSAPRVLQPYAFRKPLEEFIRGSRSWERETGDALTALAQVTPPVEWIRYVSDLKATKIDLFRRLVREWTPWVPKEHLTAYLSMLDRIASDDPNRLFRDTARGQAVFVRRLQELL